MFYWSTSLLSCSSLGTQYRIGTARLEVNRLLARGRFRPYLSFADWSMVSCMRMLDEGAIASTLFEELYVYFRIAIILWSRTSKTPDPKITSAALSIGFAYVVLYAGSISQLSTATISTFPRCWRGSRADIYVILSSCFPYRLELRGQEHWFNPIH